MIEIIPAIDLIDGKCVRLSQGDFASKKIYSESPVDVAKQFEAAGMRRLHVVDLDGARTGKMANVPVMEAIATQTGLQADYSGGIKTDADIKSVFDAGAAFACVGSIAIKQPDVLLHWIKAYGADKIILGADVKDEKIAINGWQQSTDTSIFDFIDGYTRAGIMQVLCTDVAKDGMLQGASTALYQKIVNRFPGIGLLASGGVSSMADIAELEQAGCSGVIIGKAYYEGRISLKELEKYTA